MVKTLDLQAEGLWSKSRSGTENCKTISTHSTNSMCPKFILREALGDTQRHQVRMDEP